MRVSKQVTIQLPDEVSPEGERFAKEFAIVALYHRGEISTREAADLLGLTYREYLDFLADRGLPQTSTPLNSEILERIITEERGQQ